MCAAVTDYVGYRVCRERAHHISNATDADVCPAKKWCDAQDEVSSRPIACSPAMYTYLPFTSLLLHSETRHMYCADDSR
jgi:hypothetical protein